MKYENQEVSGLLSFFVDGTRTRLVAQAVSPGKRVLDIGCGNGLLLKHLPPDIQYVGVELDPEILDHMRHKYPQHRFIAARAGTDPLPEGPFDVVIMAGFIEHLEFHLHKPLLQSIRKVIADQGEVILTTPTVFGGRFHKWLAQIGLVSKEAADEHKGFLSRGDLGRLFGETGFAVKRHGHYFLGLAHFVTARPS